jgi:hypothetical protein
MGSSGILVSGALAMGLGARCRSRFRGFDRQTRGMPGAPAGLMAPLGRRRREALLFRGDGHGDTFQS